MNMKQFTTVLKTAHYMACAALCSVAASNAIANPSGANVVHGSASFSTPNASTLNITNTPGTIINWQQFGIGANEVTRFIQESANSAVLNRVTGGSMSEIYGTLASNGQVYLINPAGIVFGQNAVIDTAGLIASTLNLSNQNFLDKHLHFEDLTNNAEILNKGFIHTSNDGEVVLIAPHIKNEGVIDVEQGKLLLAAGQSVTVSSLNYDNIEFEVQAPEHDVVNIGELMSDGGSIGVFAGSITNSGTVSANAVSVNDAGKVVFSASNQVDLQKHSLVSAASDSGNGGDIQISADSADNDISIVVHNGEINANGVEGGEITVEADAILSSGDINARGINNGGKVNVRGKNITATKHARVNVDSENAKGGDIVVHADESILTSATYNANGKTGGNIHLLSPGTVSLAGAIALANGTYAGGNIRVGGGIQGGEGLISATNTLVNASSILSAKATMAGDGGTVAVWSDSRTAFYGNINISGGYFSGDGGFAEVSSKGAFQYGGTVHRRARNGNAGILLLDPVDINIGTGGGGLSVLELIDVNPGNSEAFGGGIRNQYGFVFDNNVSITAPVLPLSNGNIVVTDPNDFGGMGAAYMFDDTGTLITTLTGGSSLDEVGNGGATAVGLHDNAVISSTQWNGGAGAWTFINGTTGDIGNDVGTNSHAITLGTPLSLTGSAPGDGSGAYVTHLLFNATGDYIVSTPNWSNGATSNVGAVTHVSGATGVVTAAASTNATISEVNSIIGRNAGDQIGSLITAGFGGFGHFMVGSLGYTNDEGDSNAGIAFMANGVTGQYIISGGYGQISDSRGLHGDNVDDFVSSAGIYRVGAAQSDFVVASPNVNIISFDIDNAGAATFVSGSTGSEGLIGPAQNTSASPDNTNSLMGTKPNDKVSSGGIVSLEGIHSNNNYLVVSEDWDRTRGAVTLGNGAISGDVSETNSITGQVAGDAIGRIAVALSNGNFAVGSSSWSNNGAGTNRGAVTIGNGATGHILSTSNFGDVTNLNSLFGANDNDLIGNRRVVALENGNLVVVSDRWNNNRGAITVINIAGEIASQNGNTADSPDETNSIIGATPGDQVGQANTNYAPGIADIGNGNFAIVSSNWQLTGLNVGAITLANGADGSFVIGGGHGEISTSNSITGSTAGDLIDAVAVSLDNGHFIVAAPAWDDFSQAIANVGAVAHVNGSTGAIGGNAFTPGTVISPANALVGSQAEDTISGDPVDGFEIFLMVLDNGDYVIGSPNYNNRALTDAGAITVGDGDSGTTGFIDATNSVRGDNDNDRFGSGRFIPHFDNSGRFISMNPDADSDVFTDNGNVFLIDPTGASTISNIVFTDSNGSSLNISAADIAATLAQGPLILQASNNINVNADIVVGGAGGNTFTLQAGKGIDINASIDTNNGKLILVANDPNAVSADRTAGEAFIDQLNGTTIDTGTGNLEVWMRNGETTAASNIGDDIVLADITTNDMIITQHSLTDGSDILRANAANTITANSFFINHDGALSGSVGTAVLPLSLTADFISAHIHGQTTDGIFMLATDNGAGSVTVGDTCYGAAAGGSGCDTLAGNALSPHAILGMEMERGGDINLNVTGNLIINEQVLVQDFDSAGDSGTVVLSASGAITSNANVMNTTTGQTIDFSAVSNVNLVSGTYRGLMTASGAAPVSVIDGDVSFDNLILDTDLFITDTLANSLPTTVTVIGDLNFGASNPTIALSAGTNNGQDNALLEFDTNNATLGGTGFVTLNSTGAAFAFIRPTSGNDMTIGSNVRVDIDGSGQVGNNSGGARISNQGLIVADTVAGSLHSVINVDNAGTILVDNSADVSIGGVFSNTGSLQATNSGRFVIQATLTGTDLVGLDTSGGGRTTRLTGTVNNSGQTITLTPTTGDIDFSLGRIIGGTVTSTGGNLLVSENPSSNGRLEDVTLDNITLTVGANDWLDITGDLTLSNSASVTLDSNARMDFVSATANLNGTGNVELIGNTGTSVIQPTLDGATLTIANGIDISGRRGRIGSTFAGRNTVNQGTISADEAGQSISLHNLVNDTLGRIEALDAGIINLSTNARTNDGTMYMDAASTISTQGQNFTNNSTGVVEGEGLFDLDGATFTNNGTVSPAGSGAIGVLTIEGDFVQGASGLIEVDFDDTGTTPGADYDQLVINTTGSATMDGAFTANQIGDASAGDLRFIEVVNGGTLSGTFTTVTSPNSISYGINFVDMLQALGVLITWDGGGLSDDNWENALNWDNDVVPTTGDSVFIGSTFTPRVIGVVDDIVDLTIDGGTLNLDSSAFLNVTGDLNVVNNGGVSLLQSSSQLEIDGNASFSGATSSLNIGSGAVTIHGVLNHAGTITMSGGTLVLNGLNNTLNILDMFSNAFLLGTGNSRVTGPMTWSESTISHNLNIEGDLNVPFITGNAVINGGVVTLANTGGTREINNAVNIIGSGQLINEDILTINDSGGSIRSADNTGIFDNRATGSILLGGSGSSIDIGLGTGLTIITSGNIDADIGTIDLNSLNAVQWAGGTWTAGGGSVNVIGELDLTGPATKVLDGFNFTSQSTVRVTGQGDLDIINSGSFSVGLAGPFLHSSDGDIISSDSSGAFTVNSGATFSKDNRSTEISATFVNNGTVDISNNGTLILSESGNPNDTGNYTMSGNSRLEIASDRHFLNGDFNFTEGTFAITRNANVVIGASVGLLSRFHNLVLNTSGTLSGPDFYEISGSFDWLSGGLTIGAANPTILRMLAGSIFNIHVPSVNFSSNIATDAGSTVNINNGGVVNLVATNTYDGDFNVNNGGLLVSSTGTHTFTNAINGAGTITINNAGATLDLASDSSIGNLNMVNGLLTGPGNLDVSNPVTWSGGTMGGTGETNFNGGVDITGPVTLDRTINTNGGSIDNTGSVTDGLGTFGGTAAFNLTGGTFTVADSGNTHVVETGITIENDAALQVLGTLYVQLASLGVTNNGGTISGDGTIIGNVFNDGILAPGSSPGALTIDGDLDLLTNSIMIMEVLRTIEPGIDYDVLNVTGNIDFGGELSISVPSSSNLNLQDNFAPISYASSSNAQALRVVPSPGFAFDPEFGPNGMTVTVTSVPGATSIDPVGSDIITLFQSIEDIDNIVEEYELIVSPASDEDEEEGSTLVCT